MSSRAPAHTTTRRFPRVFGAGLLVVAAIIGVVGYQSLMPSSSTATAPIEGLRSEPRGALGEAATDAASNGVQQ